MYYFKKKVYVPSAISRSDSAIANLAVNLSKVLSVRSLADAEAPSKAARIAKISSANDEEEGFLRTWSPGDSIAGKKNCLIVISREKRSFKNVIFSKI